MHLRPRMIVPPSDTRRRSPGRPAVPPWYAPASLAAGLPHDPAAWAARVTAALSGAATVGDAATALGLTQRTLQRLLATVREGWPELGAELPQHPAGGWRPQHATRRARGSATTG